MRHFINWSLLLILVFNVTGATAQNKPVAAVLNMDTRNVLMEPEESGNMLRMELEKTESYIILDRYVTEEIIEKEGLDKDCFSRNCLILAGKAFEVDKMITGNIERYGEKIVITLREIDVANEQISKSQVFEYQNLQNELHRMIRISVQEFTGTSYDKRMKEILIYYDVPIDASQLLHSNKGPRMGLSYIFGDMAQRLSDTKDNGGYEAYPIVSQFGYQHEIEYLSSGNFHGLFEMLFMLSGMEQQMFIPSIVLMNGFRESRKGYEIAFGPRLGLTRVADGYYEDGDWHLKREWEGEEDNPNRIVERLDNRGSLKINPGWVWAIGRTFHSGHMNIPVNVYFTTPSESGWQAGVSVGFNMRRAKN